MQPLMRPLCKAYAEISERDGQTTGVKNQDRGRQRQRKRGREREAEKERGRDSVKHSGPPSLMQTAYAHKPKSEFILLPMRSLVFALRCSVLAYAGLCESYVVRGIAYARLMRTFF